MINEFGSLRCVFTNHNNIAAAAAAATTVAVVAGRDVIKYKLRK